jgi:hypothetical protein
VHQDDGRQERGEEKGVDWEEEADRVGGKQEQQEEDERKDDWCERANRNPKRLYDAGATVIVDILYHVNFVILLF